MILTLTKTDLANAATLVLAPRFIKIGIIGSVLLILIFSLQHHGNLDRIVPASIAAITLIAAAQKVSYQYFRKKYIKQFDENRKIRAPTDITIVDGDMVARQSDGHSITKRTDVIKIQENKHIVVVYVSSLMTYVFPRTFVDQFPEFKEWLYVPQG